MLGEITDLIIKTKSLAEIDKEIRTAKLMLSFAPNQNAKNYWLEVLEAYEPARDLAEWCFDNDIPTNDFAGITSRKPPQDYRIPEILEKLKEMDYNWRGLIKEVYALKVHRQPLKKDKNIIITNTK